MAYIDKDLLLKDIGESVVFSVRDSATSPELRGARKIIDRIENAPTADVVEVVRCKDCRYSREQDKVFGITDYKCSKHNVSCLSPYDFCSYGERRDT